MRINGISSLLTPSILVTRCHATSGGAGNSDAMSKEPTHPAWQLLYFGAAASGGDIEESGRFRRGFRVVVRGARHLKGVKGEVSLYRARAAAD
jgi:hypothetical protein